MNNILPPHINFPNPIPIREYMNGNTKIGHNLINS